MVLNVYEYKCVSVFIPTKLPSQTFTKCVICQWQIKSATLAPMPQQKGLLKLTLYKV